MSGQGDLAVDVIAVDVIAKLAGVSRVHTSIHLGVPVQWMGWGMPVPLHHHHKGKSNGYPS